MTFNFLLTSFCWYWSLIWCSACQPGVGFSVCVFLSNVLCILCFVFCGFKGKHKITENKTKQNKTNAMVWSKLQDFTVGYESKWQGWNFPQSMVWTKQPNHGPTKRECAKTFLSFSGRMKERGYSKTGEQHRLKTWTKQTRKLQNKLQSTHWRKTPARTETWCALWQYEVCHVKSVNI